MSANNPRLFWKTLKPVQKQLDSTSPETFSIHYKNLLQSEVPVEGSDALHDSVVTFLQTNSAVDILDAPISPSECLKCLKRLPNAKAPGLDGIPGEFLKRGATTLTPLLVKLFNFIFSSGHYPADWTKAIICSIYKSGDKNDPANYRGISLLPILGKVFDQIFEFRLRQWEKLTSKLDQNQAGFRANYSTSDHIFTLNGIIRRYCSAGKKVYCAFIDFSKAFDTVSRTALFYKLIQEGISSKFLTLTYSMYSNTKACIQGLESDFFKVMAGVQQGAVLSPTYFAFFLNDLNKELASKGGGFVILNGHRIQSLLYADDLILPAETQEGLMSSLAILYDYVQAWGLRIQCCKIQCHDLQKTWLPQRTHILGFRS